MLKSDEGRTFAFWEATEPLVDGTGAAPDSVDVLVVGGGIAGMTTAYLLAREGRQVARAHLGLPVSRLAVLCRRRPDQYAGDDPARSMPPSSLRPRLPGFASGERASPTG